MKIKMKESHRGSEYGFAVNFYEEGNTYDVAQSLASSFIQLGWAVKADDEI